MYTHQTEWEEPVWRDLKHQKAVLEKIKEGFDKVFPDFVETESGSVLSTTAFTALGVKYGIKTQIDQQKTAKRQRENFVSIIKKAIIKFEADREKYQVLLDPDTLEEEEDDLQAFKSQTLKNECPIIRTTIHYETKELDEYRKRFSQTTPKRLFEVVSNISEFGRDYMKGYDPAQYEQFSTVDDFEMANLDGDDYTAYGCLGSGIRSHFLYKLYPQAFPNRSRNALWALWFLSGKESFDCVMDSEFLMIDISTITTQQNYFYPYDLFTYYAFQVYLMLKEKAHSMSVVIEPEYRYVVTDAFFEYIAGINQETINMFSKQLANGGFGYV